MSTAKSPLEVVRAFLCAMEKMDMEAAVRLVAPNCEYTNPPPTGTVYGPEGVRAVLGPFSEPIAENVFVYKREVANGPIVFIERLDRHRIGNSWVELPVNAVFEVHDGSIAVWHEYFDTATLQNQIAALAS
jgi:limonene-1,2-epoxide hydrolase